MGGGGGGGGGGIGGRSIERPVKTAWGNIRAEVGNTIGFGFEENAGENALKITLITLITLIR